MKRREIRETLYQLEQRRRQLLQPYFAELGLSSGQPRILDCLLARGEGMTQRELADHCGLDATTLSRALDRLTEMGLVARAPHEESRRANLVVLTAAGEEKTQAVAAGFAQMDEMLCWGLEQGELEELLARLEKLRENLEDMGERMVL